MVVQRGIYQLFSEFYVELIVRVNLLVSFPVVIKDNGSGLLRA